MFLENFFRGPPKIVSYDVKRFDGRAWLPVFSVGHRPSDAEIIDACGPGDFTIVQRVGGHAKDYAYRNLGMATRQAAPAMSPQTDASAPNLRDLKKLRGELVEVEKIQNVLDRFFESRGLDDGQDGNAPESDDEILGLISGLEKTEMGQMLLAKMRGQGQAAPPGPSGPITIGPTRPGPPGQAVEFPVEFIVSRLPRDAVNAIKSGMLDEAAAFATMRTRQETTGLDDGQLRSVIARTFAYIRGSP